MLFFYLIDVSDARGYLWNLEKLEPKVYLLLNRFFILVIQAKKKS